MLSINKYRKKRHSHSHSHDSSDGDNEEGDNSSEKCTLYKHPLGKGDIHSHYIKPVPPTYVTEYEGAYTAPDPHWYAPHVPPEHSTSLPLQPYPLHSLLSTQPALSSPRTPTATATPTGDSFSSTEDFKKTARRLLVMKRKAQKQAHPDPAETSPRTGLNSLKYSRSRNRAPNLRLFGGIGHTDDSRRRSPALQDLLTISVSLQRIGYHRHHPMLSAAIPILREPAVPNAVLAEESIRALYEHMREAHDASISDDSGSSSSSSSGANCSECTRSGTPTHALCRSFMACVDRMERTPLLDAYEAPNDNDNSNSNAQSG